MINCTCPETPDMYRGSKCYCPFCDDTLISEEKTNKRICKRCYCDKIP